LNFPSFIPDYDKICARKLIEGEMAMFPETQPLVQDYRKSQAYKRELTEMEKERRSINKRSAELTTQITIKRRFVTRFEATLAPLPNAAAAAAKAPPQPKRIGHICSCPVGECRGFIMENDFACGICRTEICAKCMHPIDSACTAEDGQGACAAEDDQGACAAEDDAEDQGAVEDDAEDLTED
jgi:hypothetical protein